MYLILIDFTSVPFTGSTEGEWENCFRLLAGEEKFQIEIDFVLRHLTLAAKKFALWFRETKLLFRYCLLEVLSPSWNSLRAFERQSAENFFILEHFPY